MLDHKSISCSIKSWNQLGIIMQVGIGPKTISVCCLAPWGFVCPRYPSYHRVILFQKTRIWKISTWPRCILNDNTVVYMRRCISIDRVFFFFFFYLGFLSRTFTNHRTAGEGGGHFFNSSLPLPPASQTIRH